MNQILEFVSGILREFLQICKKETQFTRKMGKINRHFVQG